MLKTRVLTGAWLSIVIVTVLFFSHIPWVLKAVALVLSLLATGELYRATGTKKKWMYGTGLLLVILVTLIEVPLEQYLLGILFLEAVILFGFLMMNVTKKESIESTFVTIMTVVIAAFFRCMSMLRAMPDGLYLLCGAILVSVLTDIAAYFVGKGLGKHKLAPKISPQKTVEGSIGGTVCAVLILLGVAVLLQQNGILSLPFGKLFIYLMTASVVGQFGDLALSSVKRIVGIKDYGTLLPGHGGILDRFDSLLFVLPFTYLFFA